MVRQTALRPHDVSDSSVGLDDRTLALATPVDDNDHRIGRLDASVQLVEYGDYQCPFCSEALPGVKELLSTFGDGVVFVFRHFPLVSQHPNAWRAALAAEAAGAQHRFWEMHNHLLSHQHELSDDELSSHARALGLDMDQFERDLHDAAVAERVRQDTIGGLQSGVMGTPTFFVNGQRLEGGFRSRELGTAIDSALAGPLLR
jgi:protein-disulfide isomerase